MCVCVPYLSNISSACTIENSSVLMPGSTWICLSTMVHHSSSKLKSVRLQCIWSHHSDGIHLLDPKGPGPCFGCFFSLWLPLRLTGVVTKKVIRWYQKRSCQVKKKISTPGDFDVSRYPISKQTCMKNYHGRPASRLAKTTPFRTQRPRAPHRKSWTGQGCLLEVPPVPSSQGFFYSESSWWF